MKRKLPAEKHAYGDNENIQRAQQSAFRRAAQARFVWALPSVPVTIRRRYHTSTTLPPTVTVGHRKIQPFRRGGTAPRAAGCPSRWWGRRPRLAPVASLSRESLSPRLASCGRACLHSIDLSAAGPLGTRAACSAATSTPPRAPHRPSQAGWQRREGRRRSSKPQLPLGLSPRGTPTPRPHLSSLCQPWSPSSKSRNRYRGGSGGTSLSRSAILPGEGEHPAPIPCGGALTPPPATRGVGKSLARQEEPRRGAARRGCPFGGCGGCAHKGGRRGGSAAAAGCGERRLQRSRRHSSAARREGTRGPPQAQAGTDWRQWGGPRGAPTHPKRPRTRPRRR